MLERLKKPFLTVETGEAYQPVRLTYKLSAKEQLLQALNKINCLQKTSSATTWNLYWEKECDDIHFESIEGFRKIPQHPVRIGTLTLKEDKLYFNLPSFKRACLVVSFFHKFVDTNIASVQYADFFNKVFATDERFPHHGFTELFKEEELERILNDRMHDYEMVKERCEQATTADEAFEILAEYTKKESQKRLPYAERYFFQFDQQPDPEIVFLAFYIFLRGREMVAIKRWFGQAGYTMADALDDTVEAVFGGMDTDIIE